MYVQSIYETTGRVSIATLLRSNEDLVRCLLVLERRIATQPYFSLDLRVSVVVPFAEPVAVLCPDCKKNTKQSCCVARK